MFAVVHQQDLHNLNCTENLRAVKPSPLPFVPLGCIPLGWTDPNPEGQYCCAVPLVLALSLISGPTAVREK